MKPKWLEVVGVLALLALQPLSPAVGSLSAYDSTQTKQQISSGAAGLAPLAQLTHPVSGNPLTFKPVGRRAYIFIKNVGTLTLKSFSLTQTVSGTSVYICETSKFVNNNVNLCESGEIPRLVGSTTTINDFVFTTPLPPNQNYWLGFDSPNNNQTSISILIKSNSYHSVVRNS
jgi:hypothetical protein